MLQTLYPHIDWRAWQFNKVPTQHWTRSKEMEWINNAGETLRVKHVGDWLSLRVDDLTAFRGGNTIIKKYSGSMSTLIKSLYPDFEISNVPNEEVTMVPQGYWHSIENQRNKIDDIGKKLGVKTTDDWKRISRTHVQAHGGNYILSRRGGSLDETIRALYPRVVWHSPHNHFASSSKQYKVLESIAKELDIKHLDDWLSVPTKRIDNLGGFRVLRLHGNSLRTTLQHMYRNHNWKWDSKNRGYWQKDSNQRQFLEHAATLLGLDDANTWYKISHHQLATIGGAGVLRYYPEVLTVLYPTKHWEFTKFRKAEKSSHKTNQWWLTQLLSRKLFLPS